MVYLETGKMSWASTYGTGRYIRELMKSNIYDYVICAVSQKDNIPLTNNSKVIVLDDERYKERLSAFLQSLQEGDVIHFPANTIVVDFIPKYIKVVYTIHDLTPLFFYKHRKRNGNYFSDGAALTTAEWKANVFYALKRADRILTVSENTKSDILKYFSVPEQKIKVIYHGIDTRFEQYSAKKTEEKKALYGLKDKKMILCIAGGKHKNLVRVILAFYLLCLKNRKENYLLVLVGGIIPKIDILTKALQKKKRVFLTGRISDEELVWAYNLSDCFVFASLYEGFGFPLLEAYACGTWVAAADTSSLKELNGGYAKRINPRKIVQIACAMEKSGYRPEALVQDQINYARTFTWEKFRQEHKRVLDELIGK